MEHKVTSCRNSCPMYDTEYWACNHPTYPQKEANYSANEKFCPLKKEPLTLVASFK